MLVCGYSVPFFGGPTVPSYTLDTATKVLTAQLLICLPQQPSCYGLSGMEGSEG